LRINFEQLPILEGFIDFNVHLKWTLCIEANPNLTWRDVRYILAMSAEKIDDTDPDWTTNGAGYPVNHKYGFGRINAKGAVALADAETWRTVGPERSA
jgi:hypothetical protein